MTSAATAETAVLVAAPALWGAASMPETCGRRQAESSTASAPGINAGPGRDRRRLYVVVVASQVASTPPMPPAPPARRLSTHPGLGHAALILRAPGDSI